MNTPIYDFVKNYNENKWSRFHMPGHKGHVFFGCEPFDITEIEGADVLHHGKGIIYESEKNARELFGSGITHFSTEGSTHCIKTMLTLLVMESDTKTDERPYILASRNVHRSMIDACGLLDLDISFMWGASSDHLCSCVVTPEMVAERLDNAKKMPLGVYITSPDYLGKQMDIENIAKVCKKRNIPFLVDNAHGAYLHFLEKKCHPMDFGATMCADSAHKTLPALTGAAYLHIHKDFVEKYEPYVNQAMSFLGSTSPSYIIMQSLDLCNKYLYEKFESDLKELTVRIDRWKKWFEDKGGIVEKSEPLKIVLNTAKLGYTGDVVADEMRKNKIECEYSDGEYVVLMLTPQNDELDFIRLEKWANDTAMLCDKKEPLEINPLKSYIPNRKMSIREAIFAKSENVFVDEAEGRICAAETVSCPPAVPIAVSGEEITQEMIEEFRKFGINQVSVVL